MTARLPAHLEASAIVRLAEAQGGFATVLAKGEHDAGTILLVTLCRGHGGVLYERMPQLDGTRKFLAAKREDNEKAITTFNFSECDSIWFRSCRKYSSNHNGG